MGKPEDPRNENRPMVIGWRVGDAGSRRGAGRLVLGLFLLGLGVLFALDNMGIVDAGSILRLWPAIFIFVGINHLAGVGRPRRVISGTIFTTIGLILLLDQFHVVSVDASDLLPLALIFIGFVVIVKTVRARDELPQSDVTPGSLPDSRDAREGVVAESGRPIPDGRQSGAAPRDPGLHAEADDRNQIIRAFALLGGVTRRSGADFRGGEATAMLGGVEIDLRSARPARNVVTFDVTAMWGGIDILIPPDWVVSGEVTPLLGAFQDNSHPPAGPARTTLIVRGVVIMGGIEVKN